MDLINFPNYYMRYSWNAKHKLFGYPQDAYPDFKWIKSLEERFLWLSQNSKAENTASKYLIQEMIEWGGSQNGVLQKFNDKSGEVNLYELVQQVIINIDDAEKAIRSALEFPGLGLTYASKLLRFMKPEKYGALDSRLRKALLKNDLLPKIADGQIESMITGYLTFLKMLEKLKMDLKTSNIEKPECKLSKDVSWNASQIEMALFCWAEQSNESEGIQEHSTGSTTKKNQTKMDKARAIFQEMRANNCSREDIINAFINDANLTKYGASTYYQTLKTAANKPT